MTDNISAAVSIYNILCTLSVLGSALMLANFALVGKTSRFYAAVFLLLIAIYYRLSIIALLLQPK